MKATLHIYRGRSLRRSQRWRWRLVAGNGRIVAESGEGYSDRGQAEMRGRGVTDGVYRGASVEVRP